MNGIYEKRLERFRQILKEKEMEAFLVSIGENRRYLSGFTGEDTQFDESSGYLLITEARSILVTDSRYTAQAKQECPLFEVVEYKAGLAKVLPDLLTDLKVQRLGFENKRMAVAQYEEIRNALKEKGVDVDLLPSADAVDSLRLIKDDSEIALTRKAAAIAEAAFLKLLDFIKPGMTEREIAWEFEVFMRKEGAEELSFPTIFASGPNSALPHAIPGNRKISRDEPIVIDWGVKFEGYCSDATRTIVIGKPDEELKKVHRTVREAQRMAMEAIRPGADGKAVDQIARDHIHNMGYKDRFGHGLGHGTGLAIHEAPRLSPLSTSILQPGMIVTVEPGIYIPGWGGVRIENQVVVREDGAEVLNSLSTTICFDEA